MSDPMPLARSWRSRSDEGRILSAVTVDGEERVFAQRHQTLIDTCDDDIYVPEDASFHSICYAKFTDKKRISKPSKRKERGAFNIKLLGETDDAGPSPKTLLSRILTPTFRGSQSVLPQACTICKRKDKWIRVRNKSVSDRLIQTETKTAGCLLEAALQR